MGRHAIATSVAESQSSRSGPLLPASFATTKSKQLKAVSNLIHVEAVTSFCPSFAQVEALIHRTTEYRQI